MMPRKSSKMFENYKQNDDQQLNDQHVNKQQHQQQQQSGGYEHKDNNNSLIADMAQGFIQAQAVVTDKAMSFNNQEITLLLQKV